MKENIRIRNRSGVCSIDIEGTIGVPEAWQFDDPAERVATYDAFREAVQRIGRVEADEVVVNIRSTGGDVNDALLIYDALRALDARIVTRCYGYTASAATIIAQAASEGAREVSANALYLVHKASCAAEGNAEELAARIEALGARATPCGSVAEGVAKAIEAEGADGVACALGSLYMSGEVRACFQTGKD